MSVSIKNLQLEDAVKFTGLSFVSISCTVDSTFCTITESNIHVKSCKARITSLCTERSDSMIEKRLQYIYVL